MSSFISTFITVGICMAIYAYIKNKYSKEVEALQNQIADLNLDIIRSKTRIKEQDGNLVAKDREISSYKSKLETMVDINKDLVSAKSVVVEPAKLSAPKKRGRKPGTKKPFFNKNKKKSGGSAL